MANQSLTAQDQRLTTQDSNSKLERAKRLLSRKAIFAWALVLWTIIKSIYQSLNFASVVEFAAGLGRNPHVKAVLDFILSPWGQVLTTLLGIAWLTYLVIKPQKAMEETAQRVESEQPVKLPFAPEKPKPKLTFEIDEQNSQVLIERGGPDVSRITAELRVRCEKEIDTPMTVRGFSLSLHRLLTDGQVTTISHQNETQVIWNDFNGAFIAASDGWTIDNARSDFRRYNLTIEISPKIQDGLTSNCFLQVTMDAIQQDPVSKPLYVKDWTPDSRYSLISLEPFEIFPLKAQKEISKLKAKVASAEETIERLGRHNEKYNWLTTLAEEQKSEIDKHVSLKEFQFCYMEQLTPLIFRVVFALFVTNNSVLDIGLSDELGGTIRFEGIELLEKKRVISPLKDAPHCTTRSLTIEQRLSKGEADTIRDANGKTGQANFEFDDLVVNIVGGSRSPHITSKQLKIPKNTTASAFPVTQVIRSVRVKALSHVWGRCVQLQEPLRIGDTPILKSAIENWESGSLLVLEREGYTRDEAKKLMQEVMPDGDFPETSAPSQRQWIHYCIAVLEDLIAKEIKAIHGTAEPRRLTQKEILRRIEELPLEDQARAYKAFGALLEKAAASNKPNK